MPLVSRRYLLPREQCFFGLFPECFLNKSESCPKYFVSINIHLGRALDVEIGLTSHTHALHTWDFTVAVVANWRPLMHRLCQCALVIASLVSLEGVSFARPTSSEISSQSWVRDASQAATSLATRESSGIALTFGNVAVTGVSSDLQARFGLGESAMTDFDAGNGYSPTAPTGDALAGIRLCHISHHPRDGVRAEIHACPLLIADSNVSVSPAPDASVAIASVSVQVD